MKHNVRDIDELKPRWRKGGPGKLATAHYGPPNVWLVDECKNMVWRFGDRTGILPARNKHSPLRDIVFAVYELATGEPAEQPGVGLSKVVDTIADQWRTNERSSQATFAKTSSGVIYVQNPPAKN